VPNSPDNCTNEGQIVVAIAELSAKIETLIAKQEELAINVSKIKEAVYNPDEGLYARLNKLDIRLLSLESWKSNNTKIMWIVITATVSSLAVTAASAMRDIL
jgi:hypothetical protein